MASLPSAYDPKEAEKRLQQQWEKTGVYNFADDLPKAQTFVIDTPPPTVSGVLHMGHIFSYTQADFVARYQRMSGRDVFYPMGFDDNGLPTERLVEKVKDIKAHRYIQEHGREAFIQLCREVVLEAEEEFRRLFKSVALSVDWNQEYQTISDDVRKLSQASFVDLYNKGEAYRDFRPTYWDWVDQTAIAQAEIENKEMPGVMNDIQFTLEDGTPIVIATTRPELLGACVAVMYHPEDPNAAKYKGKHAVTPLFGVKVPMIADEAVEREKGTGLVMCCTFGDDTDKEWWRKYKLPIRNLIAPDGKMSDGSVVRFADTIPLTNPFVGFTRGRSGKNDFDELTQDNCIDINKTIENFERGYKDLNGNYLKIKPAREKIIELLKSEGKILKQINISHSVKCAERSGTPIEIIPTSQWFLRIADKKEELIAKGNKCEWFPEYMHIRLNQWIEGLKEDWCISRQRFFGVPFPAWQILNKRTSFVFNIVAPANVLPIDPINTITPGFKAIHKEKDYWVATAEREYIVDGEILFAEGDEVEITPSLDVMDTWATSSISPQLSAKGITNAICKDEKRFAKLFPADLRPQAHEIIRTWAFYTIVKAHLHADSIPWKNLMISGWCLAADKSKMSKSKGNVVTPVALIEEKGSDAVRYWASTSRLGSDTAFSEDVLKIGRKLVTKLWNASNFVAIQLEKLTEAPGANAAADVKSGRIAEPLDLWILTRLHRAVAKATAEFERFEYADARAITEDFFWNDLCDNYLELVKARAYGEGVTHEQQLSSLLTLQHVLHAVLRLFAPFVPHVTEEIYSHLFALNSTSIHARGTWPKAEDYAVHEKEEAVGIAVTQLLNVIRKTKSEANVSIKFPVNSVDIAPEEGAADVSLLERAAFDLKSAGTVSTLRFLPKGQVAHGVLTENGAYRVAVSLADVAEKGDAKKAPATLEPRTPGDDKEIRGELERIGNVVDAKAVVHGVGKVNEREQEAYKVAKAAIDKAEKAKGQTR